MGDCRSDPLDQELCPVYASFQRRFNEMHALLVVTESDRIRIQIHPPWRMWAHRIWRYRVDFPRFCFTDPGNTWFFGLAQPDTVPNMQKDSILLYCRHLQYAPTATIILIILPFDSCCTGWRRWLRRCLVKKSWIASPELGLLLLDSFWFYWHHGYHAGLGNENPSYNVM